MLYPKACQGKVDTHDGERSGAKSGFAPNMLICGILLKGDLLTYCDIDDCINQSCGAEEFKLVNLEKVEVQKVGANQKKQLVTVDRFLTHKGMIFRFRLHCTRYPLITTLPSKIRKYWILLKV